MKDSPNSGWAEKPLGEVVTVTKTKGGSRPLPYVGLEDISSDGTGEFKGSLEPQGDKSTTFEFGPRHLLYGRLRPYLNKVYRPDFEGHCSSEIFPMLPDKCLDRGYLFHWITSDQVVEKINATSTGARMPRANVKEILQFPIPLPPLEEQQRIVAVLDEAFKGLARARAHAEANLQNARELFERSAAITFEESAANDNPQTFLVEELALPEKGSIRTGPFGSQLKHSEFVDEGISVLGIDNAVQNEFRWGKARFISEEKYEGLRRYTVKPRDVIITIMGTCGRCAIIPDDIPTAVNTKHLCCISLNQSKCLPEFLHRYFLHSPQGRDYLSAQASGSVMDGLNMGIIKAMPVDVPPLEKQKIISDKLAEIDEHTRQLAEFYKSKVQDLYDLRQSLLQKAFAGELT